MRDRKYIIILLSLGEYKMVERKIVTGHGQGYGLGIGGCKRLCPTAKGHSLVTLLFPVCVG